LTLAARVLLFAAGEIKGRSRFWQHGDAFMTGHHSLGLSLILAVFASPLAFSAEREVQPSDSSAAPVDLFEAMKSGDIEARFIPRNAASGTVLITNKTEQPLAIRLPEALAGVPVLAQVGPGINLGNGQNRGNNGANAGNQSVGAAINGIGQGPGIFNVDAGRARKLKVVSVCLDYGKPDPGPRIPYELVPLTSRTADRRLMELVKMLGSGATDQQAAQAAAWHLANELSWQELASKSRVKHIGGKAEPLFNASQLDRARQLVDAASRLAAKPAAIASYRAE